MSFGDSPKQCINERMMTFNCTAGFLFVFDDTSSIPEEGRLKVFHVTREDKDIFHINTCSKVG